MRHTKQIIISTILTIIAIGIFYYAKIPALNVHSKGFWWFLIGCVIIVAIFFGIPKAKRAGEAGVESFKNKSNSVFDTIGNFRDKMNNPASWGSKNKSTNAEEVDATVDGKKSSRKHKVHKGPGMFLKSVHKGFWFWCCTIVVISLLVMVVGDVVSSTFFNARSYSNLIQTEDGDFADDIAEIPMSSVPVVDRDTAITLGSRTIGEISDLVSQYSIDESTAGYTQINYKGSPYRVSSLKYADIIKWLVNTSKGLPGYVTVNMATQETKLVRLEEGNYMHISTGEYFNKYLYRYLRFQYPTTIFGEASFEIDDDGNPYWIVPIVKYRIGLFGGEDYDGALIVNACSGEVQRCSIEEIPSWCDKVFAADLIYEQLQFYGKYQKGFWNSLIGQSGVLCPTGSSTVNLFGGSSTDTEETTSTTNSGYNYLAIDNDVYMYTGMTSANSDESLVGFVLTNLRTKTTKYYVCAGATESSAQSSAEGQVQQMEYQATAPLLLNVADRPTYFLSLKDQAGLVKMYAYIDVQKYQIVGTGSTVSEAQKSYVNALRNDSEVNVDEETLNEAAEGSTETVKKEKVYTVDAIEATVVNGNTIFYIKMKGEDVVYTANINLNAELPFLKSGSKLTLTYTENGSVREINSLTVK
jgi:hypothetical protein